MSLIQDLLQLSEEANSTIEVDIESVKTEDELKEYMKNAFKDNKMFSSTYQIRSIDGPAGWPVIRISGPEDELKRFIAYEYDDKGGDLSAYKV